MGKPSRDKGARGEREVVAALRRYGLRAERTASLQAAASAGEPGHPDVSLPDFPGLHVEVKRQETLRLPAWTRQADAAAGDGADAVVAYRQSGQPWRVCVELDLFAALLAEARSAAS